MIFLKKCFVSTSEKVDTLSIIHDIRYALRDSKAKEGLVTVVIPKAGAGLALAEMKETPTQGTRTLTLPFAEGQLLLAPREEVFLIDYETRPARREFTIHVMSETPPAEDRTKRPMGKLGGR